MRGEFWSDFNKFKHISGNDESTPVVNFIRETMVSQEYNPEGNESFVSGNVLVAEYTNYARSTGECSIEEVIDVIPGRSITKRFMTLTCSTLNGEFLQPQCKLRRYSRDVSGQPRAWGISGVNLRDNVNSTNYKDLDIALKEQEAKQPLDELSDWFDVETVSSVYKANR